MPRAIQLLAVAGLACLLSVACTTPTGGDAGGPGTSSLPVIPRDYWPTEGWRTAEPEQQGIDSDLLATLDTKVPDLLPRVRSLLVVRHGYLVYERYWQGLRADDGHIVYSVTKSVVSALIGIALRDQHLDGLGQSVEQLLASHVPTDADPRLRRATVKQLLTMTSGLASDDSAAGVTDPVLLQMLDSPDWVRHILGRTLETSPGTHFAYSNAASHLLSAIIADSTGQSTLDFARAELFGPLGIATDDALEPKLSGPFPTQAEIESFERARVGWPTDPQGYHFGATFLKLPARDLAKLGYLYLNAGRWDETQIVPADYVRDSIQPHSDTGTIDYGYQWWVRNTNGTEFSAQGAFGQLIYVNPRLDLVVVTTSDVDPNTTGNDQLIWTSIDQLISTTITPAITP